MAAAKHNDQLFAQASRPAASFGTVVLFLLTFALMLGGFYLFSIAFEVGDNLDALWLFTAGLVLDTIAFFIAFALISGREKMALDTGDHNA